MQDNPARDLVSDEEKRRQKRRNSFAQTVLTGPEGMGGGKTTLG